MEPAVTLFYTMITQRETNYWNDTDLSLEGVTRMLGAGHVEWVRNQAHPVGVCESRAAGAWQANDAESFCAYRSLAAHLREGR